MSLTLHFHPLSSFCQKVVIALHENGTPFTPHLVDLGHPAERDALRALWPIGKFPVLRDETKNRTVAESTVIIEYLAQHYPGPTQLLPADPDLALRTRAQDRFFDLHVQVPMQKIVGDRLRPKDKRDPHGVEEARATLRTALGMVERDMAAKRWAMGESFTMADCAAAPALFYADKVMPLAGAYPNAASYLDRLMQRPSYARALKDAEPYLGLFPED